MKTLGMIFVLVLSLSGCSKTSIVFDEDSVVTAVTEAPTFRFRESLITETTAIVESMCGKIKESGLSGVNIEPAQPREVETKDSDSAVLKDIKELFELVDNIIDLVPSHSVSISVKCVET